MATFTLTVGTSEAHIEPWEHATVYFHVDTDTQPTGNVLLTVASGSDRMLTKGKTEFLIPLEAWKYRKEVDEVALMEYEGQEEGTYEVPTVEIWGADLATTEIATQGAVPSAESAELEERAFFNFKVYALEWVGEGNALVPVDPD